MIDVVMITTLSRPELFQQSLLSLHENCATRDYTLTVVVDRHVGFNWSELSPVTFYDRLIINQHPVGASASRNIGASSIPKYRRQKYVMFLDDDVFMCPKWDEAILNVSAFMENPSLPPRRPAIISGHAHPFNHGELYGSFTIPLVISSVHMLMPWSLWDDVGYFCEPGGPGGSEDYAYCMAAKAKGYGFAVTEHQCVLHTGITSSSGKPIVGQSEVIANNERLVKLYGLKNVRFE